jgi:hypothetical protein
MDEGISFVQPLRCKLFAFETVLLSGDSLLQFPEKFVKKTPIGSQKIQSIRY